MIWKSITLLNNQTQNLILEGLNNQTQNLILEGLNNQTQKLILEGLNNQTQKLIIKIIKITAIEVEVIEIRERRSLAIEKIKIINIIHKVLIISHHTKNKLNGDLAIMKYYLLCKDVN